MLNAYLAFLQTVFYESPQKAHTLYTHFPSFEQFKENIPTISKKLTEHLQRRLTKTLKNWNQIHTQYTHENCQIITFEDSHYPSLLKEISDPPLALFCKGNSSLLKKEKLSFVGPRNHSHYAEKATQLLVSQCCKNFVITSGLARGIDTIAHQTALNENCPTIAVLATPIDTIYPTSNQDISKKIIETGCIITEFPLGTSTKKHHFPQRNRIISGLSMGTVITEASFKSGSLITARFAIEQNRDVFAVPGSIFEEHSEGVHKLIQDGAKLVSSATDIYSELNKPLPLFSMSKKTHPSINLTNTEEKFISFFTETPQHLDSLIYKNKLSVQEVLQLITSCEIKGLIKETSPQYYAIHHVL